MAENKWVTGVISPYFWGLFPIRNRDDYFIKEVGNSFIIYYAIVTYIEGDGSVLLKQPTSPKKRHIS